MDNIAQRLGLVVHWVGLLATVFVIVMSLADNEQELRKRTLSGFYGTDECTVFHETKNINVPKDGECFLRSDFIAGNLYYENDDNKWRIKFTVEPSIIRWIQESITTMFEYWIFLCGILYGWLIRFILTGKIHALPWKK